MFLNQYPHDNTNDHQSRTETAAHTEPIVMAKPPEFCCEESGDTVRLGLGWAERVELRQDGSGTNSPEPSISVQAIGMRVMLIIKMGDVYIQFKQ